MYDLKNILETVKVVSSSNSNMFPCRNLKGLEHLITIKQHRVYSFFLSNSCSYFLRVHSRLTRLKQHLKKSNKNLKPAAMPRITRRHRKNSGKIQRIVSGFETLPNELISEVLARVAASSVNDIINAKLSCKTFKEIGEDSHVYHHMSLDKKFIDSWTPLSEEQQVFLNKCWESENPELLYRQAISDYFKRADIESACKYLLKAVDARHIGALYLTCIMLILTNDDKFKDKGIEMISNMQKSTWLRRRLALYRQSLKECLRRMWAKNPIFNRLLVFCQIRHQNHWRSGWRDMDAELQCQACCVDREISAICGYP